MDKNTIIGFLLIGVALFAFSWFNRPSPEQIAARQQQAQLDSIAQAVQAERDMVVKKDSIEFASQLAEATDSVKLNYFESMYGVFASSASGEQQFETLENDKVKVKLSTKGASVYAVELKEYKKYDNNPLILFDGEDMSFNMTLITASNQVINTKDLFFESAKASEDNSVTMRLSTTGAGYMDFIYTLRPDDYMVDLRIEAVGMNGVLSPKMNTLDITWDQRVRQLEKGRKFENQHTGLFYKLQTANVENLNQNKDEDKSIPDRLKWIAYKNKFFSTILIADDGFTESTLTTRMLPEDDAEHLKQMKTTTSTSFDVLGRDATHLTYFFGPNKYDMLKAYDKGVVKEEQLDLDNLIYLAPKFFRPINKYFILPIFNFLGNHIANYGLVIFILTLIVKTCLFPLTYKSYMSTAKMRVLRPQVEQINAKYPKQEQAMEKQRETMELYSKAGASPLSGCLPMLLQFPILIALYWLFPTSIELRQQSFLWADDLSTYDSIVSWSTNIPFISSFYGNHVSLFCLLMTAVNIIYTRYNMKLTDTGQQQQMPGMKVMMYMMPLMFLFIFNQNAAALSYYFLVSTLITILQTTVFRLAINEDKLLLKLEENKKKPQKKSSFMKRLEEAQKMQEEQAKRQQRRR